MNDVIGNTICPLMFIVGIGFLRWLEIKHPPYDWKADARKYLAEKEKELEDYKRSLSGE